MIIKIVSTAAVIRTGSSSRTQLMPLDLTARISLSAASRPNAISTETRTAIGTARAMLQARL